MSHSGSNLFQRNHAALNEFLRFLYHLINSSSSGDIRILCKEETNEDANWKVSKIACCIDFTCQANPLIILPHLPGILLYL